MQVGLVVEADCGGDTRLPGEVLPHYRSGR